MQIIKIYTRIYTTYREMVLTIEARCSQHIEPVRISRQLFFPSGTHQRGTIQGDEAHQISTYLEIYVKDHKSKTLKSIGIQPLQLTRELNQGFEIRMYNYNI